MKSTGTSYTRQKAAMETFRLEIRIMLLNVIAAKLQHSFLSEVETGQQF